ncbi:hypothetical protein H0H93_015407, partial [Arthromyces matolae]
SAHSPLHGRDILSDLDNLFGANVPPQCAIRCDPIYSVLENCTTASCLCTTANASNLDDCVDCLVRFQPDRILTGQSVLEEFNSACPSENIPPLTLSTESAIATDSSTSSSNSPASTVLVTLTNPTTSSTPVVQTTSVTSLASTLPDTTQNTDVEIPTTSTASIPSTTSSSTSLSSPNAASRLADACNGLRGVYMGLVAGVVLALA